jgi:hypothetical protein
LSSNNGWNACRRSNVKQCRWFKVFHSAILAIDLQCILGIKGAKVLKGDDRISFIMVLV